MGITIKWDCTYKCNLNCTHCINGDFLGKTDDEMNLTEIKKVLKIYLKSMKLIMYIC